MRTLFRNPAWPIYLLFWGRPAWWALGISHFLWPIVGAFMLASLLVRRTVRIPGSSVIWALFLGWMLVSSVAIDTPDRYLGFALRFSFYAAAGILFLYLYNTQRITTRAIVLSLAGYWVVVVIGGYLGVFFPDVAFHTPVEYVIPDVLLGNDYVHDMTYARFADIQGLFGYPFGRPAAFFTSTNGWGAAFGLLTPFAFAALREVRSRGWRYMLRVMVGLSVVPAIVTLNRGLWISLIIAALYASLRFLGRRNTVRAAQLIFVVAAFGLIIVVSPLGDLIGQRLSHGQSNAARQALYGETFDRVADSPLIGYGAPRPATTSGYLDSVGTQGHVLYLVFSHGYPGLLLFFAWLGYVFFRSARPSSPAAMAAHITLLIAIIEAFYYALLLQIFVVVVAAAVALRPETKPAPMERRAQPNVWPGKPMLVPARGGFPAVHS